MEQPVFETAEGLEFGVKSILAHRIGRRNQLELLVRWKGYDIADDTWEP